MTWYLRRLIGPGPICALATFVLPALLAALVNAQRNQDDVLGILLVSAGIMCIGTIAGSAATTCLAVALFAAGALLAEPPTAVLVVVGAGLYLTVVLHDVAGVLHRSPRVGRGVWSGTARSSAGVIAAGAVLFIVCHAVAGLATWQTVVVPIAVVAIGYAAKVAADAHRVATGTLRRRRSPSPE